MAIPVNVKAKLEASFHSSHHILMQTVKGNVSNATNILRHAAVRMTDEPTAQQAMAIAKILKLPKA
jgi:hypothetical protein